MAKSKSNRGAAVGERRKGMKIASKTRRAEYGHSNLIMVAVVLLMQRFRLEVNIAGAFSTAAAKTLQSATMRAKRCLSLSYATE